MPDDVQDHADEGQASAQPAAASPQQAASPQSSVHLTAKPTPQKSALLFYVAATAFALWLAYLGWVAMKVIYP